MAIDLHRIDSTVPGIPGRNIRIYVPNGHTITPKIGYPVIYMHDGQNVFAPGGPFGCWHAENAAHALIASGEIRPFLIVSIDNDGLNRRVEYVPPGDRYADSPPGRADLYANFILQDVMPFVEQNYRASTLPSDIAVAGSSLGGVVSLYLAHETDRFGRCGSMSTAMCWATGYMNELRNRKKKNLRIYHDIGTLEPKSMAPANYWEIPHELHRIFLDQGYQEKKEVCFVIGQNDDHNEPAWAQRFPFMLRWLLGSS